MFDKLTKCTGMVTFFKLVYERRKTSVKIVSCCKKLKNVYYVEYALRTGEYALRTGQYALRTGGDNMSLI